MNAKANDPFDLNAGVPGIQGDMRPKPKFADRISKRVLVAAMAFVGVLVVVFLVALDHMDEKKTPQAEEKKEATPTKDAENNKVPEELTGEASGKGENGKQPAPTSLVASTPQIPATVLGTNSTAGAGVPAIQGGHGAAGAIPPSANASGANQQGAIPPETGKVKPLTPEQQAADQEKLDRLTRMKQAKATGLAGKTFDLDDGPKSGSKAGVPDFSATSGLVEAAKKASASGQQVQTSGGGEQDEKLDFIKSSAKEDRSYHPHMSVPPLSPNEVKAGVAVPMILEQGINSDMPGQVTARVSEAVYDTVTGCRLLIPPMTKVIGKYDSKVALGQGRNLVVWNGMMFEDGSELNLAGMEAYDPSGEAGLPADVDNHYLRAFGVTFGLSMIGAGVQLSIPQPNPSSNGAAQQQTPSQIVAASFAQQYGNLGIQILSKYLAVQPTLRNFPGERFVVIVPHTIVFKKVWRDRCNARTLNQ
ncbi:MAG TPA: TrbI/VirB10 family protein [Noviherbaspirillum sp.]|nr:TrbI/VirB10 family protein [Noviherbaspirillum sp.]